ncbi:MAG: ATP phosphoribosyltransferase [Actinomycetota bacterium]|nr:ATP phosphoribosyltransferase [Actinomycetota bacterium]
MLKLVIPKGSLEQQTFEVLKDSGLEVQRTGDREYSAAIDDERISSVAILRPQEIGKYVEEGIFDLGITGFDWIVETEADVEIIADLAYAKRGTGSNLRLVLAVDGNSEFEKPNDLPAGIRVATEYPNIARRYFKNLGINAKIIPSAGATEAKIPNIVDAIIEITETGSTLRAQGHKILGDVLRTSTKLIANKQSYADAEKKKLIEEIKTLILSALEARGKVLLKLNVEASLKDKTIGLLPAMRSPTINELADGGFAIETVVEEAALTQLIPRLKEVGATDIIEIPLRKIVP